MARESSVKRRKLKGDFAGVVLSRSETGCLTVDVSALKNVEVTVIGGSTVDWFMQQAVEQDNAATVTVTKQAYNIGDVLPDGWVVGPRSPKTGIVMAIEPVSGALDGYKTWYQGEEHAKELREQGHANARQPSADDNNDELNAIYNEVVKAGHNGNAKFNTSGSSPYGKYWSGTTDPDNRDLARVQYFGRGTRTADYKGGDLARIRCVRDEPGIVLA